MSRNESVIRALLKDIIENAEYFPNSSIAKISQMDVELIAEVAKDFPSIVDVNVVAWTLSDILENNNDSTDVQTTKILERLGAIPDDYFIYFPMPKSKEKIKLININDDLQLYTIGKAELEKLQNHDKGKTAKKGILEDIANATKISQLGTTIEEGQNVLRIKAKGFAHRYADSSMLERDPLFTFKVFVAFLNVMGALKHSYLPTTSNGLQPVDISRLYSFFIYNNDYKLVTKKPTEATDNKLLEKMEFDSKDLEKINMFNKLDEHDSKNKDVTRLKNSLYWYFESMKFRRSDSIYQSIVYSCTAFDAFFDVNENKEQKALYISIDISGSLKDEKERTSNIIDIYKLRNQIIHGERQIAEMLHGSKKTKSDDWGLAFGAEFNLRAYLHVRIQKYLKSSDENK